MTMPPDVQRRHFGRCLLAGSLTLAGLPTRAAAVGKVYFGFAAASLAGAFVPLLQELQRSYQPDLGATLTFLPGNSGQRAIEAARAGPADGSTVLVCPSGLLTLAPGLLHSAADPADAFVAVAPYCEFALAFVVGPGVPAAVKTLQHYRDWLQQNPMKALYGVPGLGTAPHFVGVQMARRLNLQFKPVAYQGLLPMLKDVADGGVPAAFTIVGADIGNARDALVRPLAISSEVRWPGLPDLPTLIELGAADMPLIESFGIFMPVGTPRSKVEELNAAVRGAQQGEAVRSALRASFLRSLALAPDPYARALALEREAWRALVKREHFSLQG